MQTQTQVIAAELERVVPKLQTLYEYEDKFFSSIEKKNVEVISGRDMRIPMKLRPGGFFGYFDTAGGDLGLGDAQTYEKGVINTVNMKIGIQWDLQSQWGTDDKRKSLINNVRENLADAMKEFRRQTEAQCMTDGTGVVATVTSFTTAGGNDAIVCTTDGFRVKLLRAGQRINIYPAARTAARNATPLKIVTVDLANNTFYVPTGTVGIAPGDVILPEGLVGATPVGLYGYRYHQSDSLVGSWLGLPRATTPEIVTSSVNANNAALALPMARLCINKIADRFGMDNNFRPEAWMHLAQQQAYEDLGQMVSMIQKTASDEKLNLYFGNNMQLAGAPVKTSTMWDRTRIDFLINTMWGRAELAPIGWYEVGGRRLFELRGPSGGVATSMISYIVCAWNLFSQNPGAGAYIKNLAIPTGY